MESSLNLLGVTSLLGGNVAKGAIRYINANPGRCVTSMFVVPGLYDVSAQMLKRCDGLLAHMLNPGTREDKRVIVGMEASGVYKYIGTRSGTHAPVQNALCEGWLSVVLRSTTNNKSRLFRENQRPTAVITAKITESSPGKIIKFAKEENFHMAASVGLQIGAAIAAALMFKTRSIVGMSVVAANMVSNLCINLAITSDEYRTPDSKPTPNVPMGNAIVTDRVNNNICVIVGNEKCIQDFMQRKVSVNERSGIHNSVASAMGCITSVATVLLTPVMPQKAQLLLAAQLLIGLASGAIYSSRDGDGMLFRAANKYYSSGGGIGGESKIDVEKTLYSNRSAAIAASFIKSGGKASNVTSLVPLHDEEGNWELFIRLLDSTAKSTNVPRIADCESLDDATNKMCIQFPDSAKVLYRRDSNFSKRLVVDVIEAVAQQQGSNVPWHQT